MKTLKESLWLWGQTPGSHHASGSYKLPGINTMTPAQGCEFFDIHNCCRVAMASGPFPPFDEESRQIAHLEQVVWSIIGAGGVTRNQDGDGDLDEVVRQMEMFPNITGAILDDFFSERRMKLFPPEKISAIKQKLINATKRQTDLWVVWYDREINLPIQEYLPNFEVVTYWTWYGQNLKELDVFLDRMIEATPGKRRLAGCYMWDYGNAQPLPVELMQHQLDVYLDYINKGLLEGIVLCSNCIADIGLPTVDVTRAWLAKHRSDVIPG